MQRFIKQILLFVLIGLVPILILLGLYCIYDPFSVVKEYNSYSNLNVIPNRDFISTETFLKNYKKEKYDSFIFGSSRTLAFRPSIWLNYMPASSKPYAFDAFSETLFGIHGKIKLLDSLNVKINNCVIFICQDNTFAYEGDSKGHIFIKHPLISKTSNFDFQFTFLKSYFNPKFLLSYYFNKSTHLYFDFMGEYLESREILYDPITNETLMKSAEDLLARNPDMYYSRVNKYFYARKASTNDSLPVINRIQEDYLKEIRKILKKNDTSIRIVISPLYNQKKLHPKDLTIIRKIFGEDVYDFSGINQITKSRYNYYESSHFRPFIGDSIMKAIYN
jgi:hypothetical protein